MERQAGRMTLGRSVGARIPRAMAPAGALCSSARALQNPNFPRQAMSKPIALYLKIEARLEVEPEAFRRAEEPRQAQSRVGRDRSLTVHDLVDPAGRHAEVLRQTILSQAERLQKILVQHFARMHRTQPLHGHRLLLVVIDNLDVVRIARSHRKQIRHWSLMRMLCSPNRSPASFSSRLPGGTRRSSSVVAASSWTSFRSATR